MSLRICTAEWMFSGGNGTGFEQSWLPTLQAERFASSGRDGTVDRSPDPIPFIEADLHWTNNYDAPVDLRMSVHRASRTLIASNPNTAALNDAVSFETGDNPSAPIPFNDDNAFAVRTKVTGSTQSVVEFGRIFRDVPDWVGYVPIGRLDPGLSVHFRYRCLFSTPGEWRAGSSPRMEVFARWARLRLWSSPLLDGSV